MSKCPFCASEDCTILLTRVFCPNPDCEWFCEIQHEFAMKKLEDSIEEFDKHTTKTLKDDEIETTDPDKTPAYGYKVTDFPI